MDLHAMKNMLAIAQGNNRLLLDMARSGPVEREMIVKRLEASLRALDRLIVMAEEAHAAQAAAGDPAAFAK